MMNLKRFLSAAGATVLLAALAGCNGKEDFSDVELPGCPAGALCEENPTGDVLVEFAGPRLINVGYRCGASLGRTYAEPTEVDGRIVPTGAAVCPENATAIEYFLGHGVYLGNVLMIGRAALPQRSILTMAGEDGTVWGVQRVTLADMVETARRLPVDDARVRNRGALVLALDSDPATPDIEFSDVLHGQEGVINQRHSDLVRGKPLDTSDFAQFVSNWEPLLDAVTEADENNNVTYAFPSQSDVEDRLAYSTELTRAGLFNVVYQESELAILELIGTDKQHAADRIGTLNGTLMVLPTGEIVGLASALLSHIQGGNEPALTEQDLLSVSRGAMLDDELVLTDVSLQGLMNSTVDTDLDLVGRMLGDVLYNGVRGQNGVDYSLNMPAMVYRPVNDDFGRIRGDFLGSDVASLLHRGANDPEPKGLPMRIARTALGSIAIDQVALDAATGVYRLQLRRGCTVVEEEAGTCDEIVEKNRVNYPQEYVIEEGSNTSDPITFNFDEDVPRGDRGTGPDEMLIEIRRVGEHALIFAGQNGACPAGNAQTDFPVGYVSRTFVDEGVAESVNVVMLLSGAADEADQLYQLGTEIQGRISLVPADRPMYRLSDGSFNNGVAAQWIDNYLPMKYYRDLDVDNVDELSNEQQQRLLSYVQGSVDLQYLGATCPL